MGGPDLKLLPNLKKLEFYGYSHIRRPYHNPSTERDGLLIDGDPNGEYEWRQALNDTLRMNFFAVCTTTSHPYSVASSSIKM